MPSPTDDQALTIKDRVLRAFGGPSALARRLGITHSAISQWPHKRLPLARALQIEAMSGGQFTAEELNPGAAEWKRSAIGGAPHGPLILPD